LQSPLVFVPTAENVAEVARLIDAAGAPIASVLDRAGTLEPVAYRDFVGGAALEHESGTVAGILFATRWGGGVMLT